MRILITGGTGFIGRYLVPHFIERGDTPILLVRDTYNIANLPPHLKAVRTQIELVYADLRNFKLTVRAVRQAEPAAVIHLAAAGVTDPFLGVDTAVRNNLNGTINLIRACFEKNFGIEKLIVARTPGELTNMNVYATSKAAAWNFCQMYSQTQGWPIYGGMIFQAYGTGQPERTLIPSALTAAKAGENFPMTAGSQQRDWIHASDVAAGFGAMVGAIMPSGETADLGTGNLVSVADVVRQIYKLVDGKGEAQIGMLPSRPGETAVQIADIVKTKQLLNWQARLSLKDGLKLMLEEQ